MTCLKYLIILCLFPGALWAQEVRIKDLSTIGGVRSNELVGYGLVVGLDGTGDSLRNSPFTQDKMSNMLERLGVNVVGEQFRSKNVASVIVTAKLPPFSRSGSRIDVSVSAIGDAKSLRGGILVMTPLNAADGMVYAVAQGSIITGGIDVDGDAARTVRGVPTTAHIPSGAIVEREVEYDFEDRENIRIALSTPDFSTARSVVSAINFHFSKNIATMLDSGTVIVNSGSLRPLSKSDVVANLENIRVSSFANARVVIDQRTGTVVMNEDVRVSRIALSKGRLTITVQEQPSVVQPNPFAEGQSIIVPSTDIQIQQDIVVPLAEMQNSVSLTDVVNGLNALGVEAEDLIDILKGMKAAGALHAELIVM
jgi:flagellar P-ring protein precursor FlgI